MFGLKVRNLCLVLYFNNGILIMDEDSQLFLLPYNLYGLILYYISYIVLSTIKNRRITLPPYIRMIGESGHQMFCGCCTQLPLVTVV